MSSRHDIVLLVIPLLAVSGLALQHVVRAMASIAGVGGVLLQLPLVAVGPAIALCLVGHEVLFAPPSEDI